ncbi:cation:proton antiporter [Breoghania sp.]|uniref:cation:proton antiporter domain-containing protein n=1 Tax=Breoghania sp. TaxID=2065378 RepID=UPI00260C3F68|nr:cation:proton antiporter [Breoghania sp.]MDJ0930258.1 cation:proton antiporter [Breoghania sp.]
MFLIGLELNPARLWRMRRDIFGLGVAQVGLTGIVLSAVIYLVADTWQVAAVAGFGMALSSTAFALQLLQERGQLQTNYGQRAFAILLLQDIAIVPLLAGVSLIAPRSGESDIPICQKASIAAVAVAGILLVGRYGLNPLFSFLTYWRAQCDADRRPSGRAGQRHAAACGRAFHGARCLHRRGAAGRILLPSHA